MGMTLSVQCNYDVLVCVCYGSPTVVFSLLGWDVEHIQKLENTVLCFPYKYDRATAANMLLMETVCRAQACCLLHCRTA